MSSSCGGCSYCDFPYEAQLPVKTDKGYEKRTFNNVNDVWSVIDLIVQETKDFNEQKNKNFDVTMTVMTQIPFFTCINHLRDKKYLRLLNKYMYCTETGTPAYNGSYGEQPAKWVEYFFVIKNVLAKKEKQIRDKVERKAKSNV